MKLLLIDDHPLFRDGLSLLIQHRLSLPCHAEPTVLEAGDLAEAAAVLQAHPDVQLALLDLNLADRQGLDTLQQWRDMAPDVPVIVLSADDRAETIVSAIDRGASGFIPKTVQAATMQDALRRVLAGEVYLPEMPGGDGPQHASPESLLGLSERQLDVLRLLVQRQELLTECSEIFRRLLDGQSLAHDLTVRHERADGYANRRSVGSQS